MRGARKATDRCCEIDACLQAEENVWNADARQINVVRRRHEMLAVIHHLRGDALDQRRETRVDVQGFVKKSHGHEHAENLLGAGHITARVGIRNRQRALTSESPEPHEICREQHRWKRDIEV